MNIIYMNLLVYDNKVTKELFNFEYFYGFKQSRTSIHSLQSDSHGLCRSILEGKKRVPACGGLLYKLFRLKGDLQFLICAE